uniref:Uncharacterized protein n=1 Tax=Canis lupus dingo TaxID=286419 RepID=A0A8C0LL50_CANLU
MLLVRLPVNSRLLVVKFLRNQKVYRGGRESLGGSAVWCLPLAWRSPVLPTRNWCSYVVTRTISCHVQNGTYLQRALRHCAWPVSCPGSSYSGGETLLQSDVRDSDRAGVEVLPWALRVNCEEGSSGFVDPGWSGNTMRPMAFRPTAFSGCLNCSKVSADQATEGTGGQGGSAHCH